MNNFGPRAFAAFFVVVCLIQAGPSIWENFKVLPSVIQLMVVLLVLLTISLLIPRPTLLCRMTCAKNKEEHF